MTYEEISTSGDVGFGICILIASKMRLKGGI